MKKILLAGLIALGLAGCTHEITVQIEDKDGRTRGYATYSEFGARGEQWSCLQKEASKLRAKYECESVLLQ